MSLMLGMKSLQKIHSLGRKAHLIHSLGSKLGRLISHPTSSVSSNNAGSTPQGVGVNNQIQNRSNLGIHQYAAYGIKKPSSSKKSYLEKK